jgi:predicted phage terminase large subunit-like protein
MQQNLEQILKTINKEQLIIQLESELGKRSLYSFFLLCIENIYKHIEFIDNWHYKYLCDILQAETERYLRGEKTEKNLLINCPIRAGKSILISEIFPVWLWIVNPSFQIMNVCATQRLATKSSRFSKLIITSEWFQKRWPILLSKDNKSKSDYSTNKQGIRVSFGVSSSIIGQGFDVCVIDDPSSPQDTYSETLMRKVITTYKDVIVGRANNNKAFKIILQQRISDKDLTATLLNDKTYRHVNITAELTKYTTPELIHYYKNGLFFPSRYSYERLEQYKRDLTPSAFASQLLQQPSALEGDLIKRTFFKIIKQSKFSEIKTSNQFIKNYLFLDTAYTENVDNDPSAFLLCSVIDKRIYIQKVQTKYFEFADLLDEIKEWIKIYNVNEVVIEAKATGLSISQELKRNLTGKCVVTTITPPAGKKKERVTSIQNYLINGKVVLVQDDWNELFLDECTNFPFGKHDDIVDCLFYAVYKLIASSYTNRQIINNEDEVNKDNKKIIVKDDQYYDSEIESLYD